MPLYLFGKVRVKALGVLSGHRNGRLFVVGVFGSSKRFFGADGFQHLVATFANGSLVAIAVFTSRRQLRGAVLLG